MPAIGAAGSAGTRCEATSSGPSSSSTMPLRTPAGEWEKSSSGAPGATCARNEAASGPGFVPPIGR